jgi:MFS family permease
LSEAAVRPEHAETRLPATGTIPAEELEAARPSDSEYTGRFGTFRSLRHRDYRLLWFGTLFTSAGQWIQQITVPWLAYQLTGSAVLLGAVNGFRSLPLLLLGPFGGVAADRVDRKMLLLWTQIFLLVTTAVMAAVIFAGQLEVWHLVVFTLLTGVAWAFNNPVRQSIVPNLVPQRDLMNALALNSSGFNFTRIIGPSLAGLMLVQLGAGENFLFQALAYLGVALLVLQMSVPPARRAARTVSVRENLVEGAAYVWRVPMLRTQLVLALVPVVVGLPYMTLLPIFADEVLGHGAAGFALMSSAVGLGAVIGTLTLASLGNVHHRGLILLGATFGLGASLIAFSLSRSFELSVFLMVVVGAFQMTYMTTNQTILQLTIPDDMRGRVMGIYMLNQGMLPAGSLFAGALAELTSAPTTVLCMGAAVCLLALLFLAGSKELRRA